MSRGAPAVRSVALLVAFVQVFWCGAPAWPTNLLSLLAVIVFCCIRSAAADSRGGGAVRYG
jgi:hypothetical protein